MANFSKIQVHKELGGNQLTVESGGKIVVKSGATLDFSALSMGTGIIHLPMNNWRAIATNDIPAKAVASGSGGALAKDSTPIHERTNAATDKSERLSWVATDQTEISQSFVIPPDWSSAGTATVKLLGYKGSNTDTTMTVAVAYWEGLGGSNLGGNTAAITQVTTVGLVGSVAVTTTAAGAYPGFAVVTLTPGTHANDALYLHAAWIEYTRKLT